MSSKPSHMPLQINGQLREVPDGLSVTGLLQWLGVTSDRVAVELNAEVVARSKHAATVLTSGDRVEVVTFVGGG